MVSKLHFPTVEEYSKELQIFLVHGWQVDIQNNYEEGSSMLYGEREEVDVKFTSLIQEEALLSPSLMPEAINTIWQQVQQTVKPALTLPALMVWRYESDGTKAKTWDQLKTLVGYAGSSVRLSAQDIADPVWRHQHHVSLVAPTRWKGVDLYEGDVFMFEGYLGKPTEGMVVVDERGWQLQLQNGLFIHLSTIDQGQRVGNIHHGESGKAMYLRLTSK
ncbi:hypothetical protein MTX78_11090 [Hymenobacter tibetensis]|uniref:Uncharacterized protein n=1 Tax=Hymenobacter tibetensis TaxID=497967 RepID=A0ABY4D557_9BACT|nr:hypothetical protein [Hymenobacter tibetensis]UOG77124.1 hypothetical protein MTX78_11090 [Hymenobacter tibetensis]